MDPAVATGLMEPGRCSPLNNLRDFCRRSMISAHTGQGEKGGVSLWDSRVMKANEANLLDFLKKSPQFVIPIYQRTYSWTRRECQQLWDDILRAGHDDKIVAHFIGSIVYIEKGLYHISSLSPLLVIDGQQRLTTVMLIIEALARRLGDREPVEGFSARKLRNYYLLNPLEDSV